MQHIHWYGLSCSRAFPGMPTGRAVSGAHIESQDIKLRASGVCIIKTRVQQSMEKHLQDRSCPEAARDLPALSRTT